MKLLIKQGHVINPATSIDGIFDVLIEEDKIVQIEKNIDIPVDRVIDGTDRYIMPGFIDLHVHLREPGFEYKETILTGTQAAAKGGFTTICPMPNTKPVIDNPQAVEDIMRQSQKEGMVHVLPIGAITIGQEGIELADIQGMAKAGAVGISEDGKSVMNSALYLEGMKLAKEANIPIFAHCEDKDLVRGGVMNAGNKAEELGLPGISNAVEDVITARDIFLAKESGARLHLCHCSTKDSVMLVKMAKDMGLPVTAEVCPHHFTISDQDILADHGDYKMNPPLRSPADVEALKQGLKANIMDAIATDHAPHGAEENNTSMLTAPFGIVGLETAFALTVTELMNKGYLTPMGMVEYLSYNPAKILGIPKGSLEVGRVADIVIADPKAQYTIQVEDMVSKGRNTPFDGKEVQGRIEMTIVSGKIVYDRTRSI